MKEVSKLVRMKTPVGSGQGLYIKRSTNLVDSRRWWAKYQLHKNMVTFRYFVVLMSGARV
jgi:hypothetical protein